MNLPEDDNCPEQSNQTFWELPPSMCSQASLEPLGSTSAKGLPDPFRAKRHRGARGFLDTCRGRERKAPIGDLRCVTADLQICGGMSGEEESPERTKFLVELEFVQCLANPHYLGWLAQEG